MIKVMEEVEVLRILKEHNALQASSKTQEARRCMQCGCLLTGSLIEGQLLYYCPNCPTPQ